MKMMMMMMRLCLSKVTSSSSLLLILFNHTIIVPLIVFCYRTIECLLGIVTVVRLAEACQVSVFDHPKLLTIVESVKERKIVMF